MPASPCLSGQAGRPASPDGGSPEKPVGTVWLAWDGPFGVHSEVYRFDGGRLDVKEAAARTALATALDLVSSLPAASS